MALFLILSPFAAFAALLMVAPSTVALFAAAAIASAAIAYDLLSGRSLKMLAAGSVMIFVAVGCYVMLIDKQFSTAAVRLTVDTGLLAIALLSLAIRLPFTIQYARESVEADIAQLPGFRHANYIITLVWAAAFVLMLFADMLMIYWPTTPLWAGVVIAFAARNSAVYFTRWYPQHRRTKAGLNPA